MTRPSGSVCATSAASGPTAVIVGMRAESVDKASACPQRWRGGRAGGRDGPAYRRPRCVQITGGSNE